jgi:membrane protease YdiL (CAAX protease family)
VAGIFAASRGDGNPLAMLGLRRCRWSAFGLALAAFGGYIVFAAIYAPLVQPEQEDVTRELGIDEGGLAAVVAGLLIIAAAPLSEEIFFRGFMFGGLRRRMSLWPAAAIAAIIFGALHYTGPDSIGVVPQLAVFGLLLAWLYEYTGSLWPPIFVHTLNNTIAFVVVTST